MSTIGSMNATNSGLSNARLIFSGVPTNRLYRCPLCSHSSTSQTSIIGHLTSVHNERLIAVCKICNQRFSSSSIGSHALHCKGSYSCPYCRSTFALPSYLQRHVSRLHGSSVRPQCDVCNKSFSSNNALVVHKRLHNDYLPFSCDLCMAKFSQMNQLKLHLDSHHAYIELNEKPKPYHCRACNRGFLFLVSLQQHSLQHCKINTKRFSCKNCGKAFAHRSELNRHSLIHTSSLPYTCPFCSRAFSRSSLLKSHILKHTDPHILRCCYCSKTYASHSYLLQHIKGHEAKISVPSLSSPNATSLSEFELTYLSDDFNGDIECSNNSNVESRNEHLAGNNSATRVSSNVNYLHTILFGDPDFN